MVMVVVVMVGLMARCGLDDHDDHDHHDHDHDHDHSHNHDHDLDHDHDDHDHDLDDHDNHSDHSDHQPEGPEQPEGPCDVSCISAFAAAGGCAVVLNDSHVHLAEILASPTLTSCDLRSCEVGIAEVCFPLGETDLRNERIAQSALAVRLAWASVHGAECRTAEKGDACFQHIRWAMQTGIVGHPGWYPGLTQWSSFEEFQALLQQRATSNCTTPCMPLPETSCHTAVPGEECHHHATWGMEVGVVILPAAYPATLAGGSSLLDDFQAWLHHIHHGNCSAPCKIPEP